MVRSARGSRNTFAPGCNAGRSWPMKGKLTRCVKIRNTLMQLPPAGTLAWATRPLRCGDSRLPENFRHRVGIRVRRRMPRRRADAALRFARFFGTDAQSWMNLQTHYDLSMAEEKLAERLDKEVKRHAA
jgi:hypothetical protein